MVQPWLALSEEELNKWQRTKKIPTVADPNPVKDSNGNFRIVSSATDTFNSFTLCNTELQRKKADEQKYNEENPNGPVSEKYKDVPSGTAIDTGLKVITYFEQKYKCSGICSPFLFYYSQSLSEGIPSSSCLTHAKSEIGDSLTYLGAATLVIGVICMLIWVCQYALWCKYEDEEDDKNGHNRN